MATSIHKLSSNSNSTQIKQECGKFEFMSDSGSRMSFAPMQAIRRKHSCYNDESSSMQSRSSKHKHYAEAIRKLLAKPLKHMIRVIGNQECIYEGETDSMGRPHGQGRASMFKNGD